MYTEGIHFIKLLLFPINLSVIMGAGGFSQEPRRVKEKLFFIPHRIIVKANEIRNLLPCGFPGKVSCFSLC